jgi:hypothetical protein
MLVIYIDEPFEKHAQVGEASRFASLYLNQQGRFSLPKKQSENADRVRYVTWRSK